MKISTGVFLLVILTSIQLKAQGYGFGRPQRGERGYTPPPKARVASEAERPDVNILTQEKATYYAELIGIDAFEKEVLKSFLKEYYTKTVDIRFDTDIKYEEKRGLLNLEQKKFETSLRDVFSEDQVITILTEEQIGDKKKKTKKKKKKKPKKKKG